MNNKKGFSLLEMVLVLILIAILTVSAAPAISDLVEQANLHQIDYAVTEVASGIDIYWANEALQNDGAGGYPSSLESGSCCFGTVLQDPITGWSLSGGIYTHDMTGMTFTYNSSSGCLIKGGTSTCIEVWLQNPGP